MHNDRIREMKVVIFLMVFQKIKFIFYEDKNGG
jgi:hypothetical protein